MRGRLGFNATVVKALESVLLGAICTLFACSGGSEEMGRTHVTPEEVVGVYGSGSDRLEIQPNGTYVQDIVSDFQPLHHIGRWRILNHLGDGSQILLVNAAVIEPATPDDKHPHLGFGDLPMYAHKRSGKVALARNEVADWYYERVQ
jgi:hypothetical protein